MPCKYPNMTKKEVFIGVDGKKLNVKRIIPKFSDNKPSFILLHDALGSVAQWKDFPETIADKSGCQVICYDRVGHGLSSDRDGYVLPGHFEAEAFRILPALLMELKLSLKPVLIGHSDGGTIALLYASRYRISAVIALAAHAYVEDETIKGVKETYGKKMQILSRLKKYHGDRAEKIFQEWADVWTSVEVRKWNILKELYGIKDPVLIIQGREDPYASIAHPGMIRKSISGFASSIILPDCGHFPHRESTTEVMWELEKFLKSQSLNFF